MYGGQGYAPPPSYVQAHQPPIPPPGFVQPYGNGQGYPGQYGQQHPSPYPPQHQQAPAPSYYGGSQAQYPPTHQEQQRYPPAYPPQQPQSPPPPPAPIVPREPNAFHSYYMNELRQLTFNSKPLINHLTLLARDNAQHLSGVVATCLENHIRQSSPELKLPPMYLLDSICKNLGRPYTDLFARTIDRIFLDVYREVDPVTKQKLRELLETWRTGSPNGGELFPLPSTAPPGAPSPQRLIEDVVFPRPPPPQSFNQYQPPPTAIPQRPPHNHTGAYPPPPPSALMGNFNGPPVLPQQQQQQNHHYPQNGLPQQNPPIHLGSTPLSSGPPPAPPASQAEKSAVLYDIGKLMEIRRGQVAANPYDKTASDQIGTLTKLENLVKNTNLTSVQISNIRDQLVRLTPAQQPQQQLQQSYNQRLATPPVLSNLEAAAYDADRQRDQKRIKLMSPPPNGLPSPPAPHVLMGLQSPSLTQRGQIPPSQSAPPSTGGLSAPTFSLQHADLTALTKLLDPEAIRTASARGAPRATATPPSQPMSQSHSYGHSHTFNGSMLGFDLNMPPGLPDASADQAAALAAANKAANVTAINGYEGHRAHFRVQMQNSDIARYRPGSSALIYEALSIKCKQCGNRYLDCPLGKERLDKDLDRHLKISRRYIEGLQRGIGRSWNVPEDEWILPPSAILPSAAVIKAEEVKKKAAITAELMNKTVPVPSAAATNDELARCPICKEYFRNEYSEDDEDWVWRNCVEVDGKVSDKQPDV